ncbi:hypothetical protein AGMMS49545_21180 [Betaproteobacteria bacterium]|nr:hypothetical protein AGMMS49545_21180 [Betaproteobacteria bacterium]
MQQDLSKAKNADVRGSLAAMRRAADEARRIAIQTDTGIVIVQDGALIHLSADDLRKQKNAGAEA